MQGNHRLRDLLLNLLLVLLIGYVLLQLFWLFYPYKPISVNNSPYPTNKAQYQAGEVVKYKIAFCKHRELPSHISKTLTGATFYALPTQVANSGELGCRDVTSSFKLPDHVNEGVHKIIIVSEVEVNPVRTITITSETKEFVVIE